MPDDFTLAAFVKRHPPHGEVRSAPEGTIARYAGALPDALLDPWRRHGPGHYGERQLEMIDPAAWQATLDCWIVSPASDGGLPPLVRPGHRP